MADDFQAYIEPKDLAEFHICMDKMDPDKLINWREMLVPLKKQLRTYPAPPQGSKYTRTFNLKRNWQYVVHSPRHAEMGNAAKYAGWVQGIEQAEIHRDRWPVAIVQADKYLTEFIEKIKYKIGRIWIR